VEVAGVSGTPDLTSPKRLRAVKSNGIGATDAEQRVVLILATSRLVKTIDPRQLDIIMSL
jgi:hypothetical protein